MNRRLTFALCAFGLTAGAVLAWAQSGDAPLAANAKADAVVVDKAHRTLTLVANGRPLKTYRVSLGGNPVGAKQREGDQKTPEGRYTIDRRNPQSGFHRALHVSYPSAADSASAARQGVPAGGDIMIHGLRNGLGWLGRLHRCTDWTAGCVAVTNAEIEEIWSAVADGTPIEIKA
jgi:murein L,D-transpeptidase YafK